MVWRLAPSRRVLVASDDYLANLGTPATIVELDAHKGIFYTNRGVADWRFATSTGVEIVRARVGLRVNCATPAMAGLGVALLPLFICGPDIRNGKLKVVDLGVQPAPEFIYLPHPEGRRPSANSEVAFRRAALLGRSRHLNRHERRPLSFGISTGAESDGPAIWMPLK